MLLCSVVRRLHFKDLCLAMRKWQKEAAAAATQEQLRDLHLQHVNGCGFLRTDQFGVARTNNNATRNNNVCELREDIL